MTKVNADSATDTGLPSLRGYISDVQFKTCRLRGVIKAIAHLENEGACSDGQAALIFLAEDMITEIDNELDSTNLPEMVQ